MHPREGTNWYENVLGRVIKPLVASQGRRLLWFWFEPYGYTTISDTDGCIIQDVPAHCRTSDNMLFSIKLRFTCPVHQLSRFRDSAKEVLEMNRCFVTNWPRYTENLAGSRFMGGDSRSDRTRRTALVKQYLNAVSGLVLDSLVGPDAHGQYWVETTRSLAVGAQGNEENPHHNFFESLHHLFCATTRVPLSCYVRTDGQPGFELITAWQKPQRIYLPAPGAAYHEIPLKY